MGIVLGDHNTDVGSNEEEVVLIILVGNDVTAGDCVDAAMGITLDKLLEW